MASSSIPPNPWRTKVVAGFGGGVNYKVAPHLIADAEWSAASGFLAFNGWAESGRHYEQVSVGGGGASYAPTAHDKIVGITQNPFSMTADSIVLGFVNDTTGVITLKKVDQTTGAATAITWDGTDSRSPSTGVQAKGHPSCLMGAASMADDLVLSFGSRPLAGSVNSVIRIQATGGGALGATWQTIRPTKDLTAAFMRGFGQRIILANQGLLPSAGKKVLISHAVSDTIWDASTAVNADEVQLGEARSNILGLVALDANALGILTREALFVMSPTNSFPPMTVQHVGSLGAFEEQAIFPAVDVGGGFCGETPYGAAFLGHDDIYVVSAAGGRKGIASKVFLALKSAVAAGLGYAPELQWHPRQGMLYVPTGHDLWAYDPQTDAWSSNLLDTSVRTDTFRHAVIHDSSDISPRHYVLVNDGTLWRESDTASDAYPDGFVETKDFTDGVPPQTMEVSSIKVHWDCIDNVTGPPVIQVEVSARDHMGWNTTSGAMQGDQSGALESPPFTTVGTLTGGLSELPVRVRGKFIRWRFTQVVNRVRIRGFEFQWRPAGRRLSVP